MASVNCDIDEVVVVVVVGIGVRGGNPKPGACVLTTTGGIAAGDGL